VAQYFPSVVAQFFLDIRIQRLCEHSSLQYCGMYSVRDIDDLASFQTQEAINGSKEFARQLLSK